MLSMTPYSRLCTESSPGSGRYQQRKAQPIYYSTSLPSLPPDFAQRKHINHTETMSADFWAGYVSGAAGILIGNPLDIAKVHLQRPTISEGTTSSSSTPAFRFNDLYSPQAVKGTAAPILGYGALNALLFMTYNRCMYLFSQDPSHPSSLGKTFVSGALAGLATFVVSAPTELVKCRAQVGQQSSWDITRQMWREGGVRRLYWGGAVTSIRDSVGYGF